jgi:hypothetical protein
MWGRKASGCKKVLRVPKVLRVLKVKLKVKKVNSYAGN